MKLIESIVPVAQAARGDGTTFSLTDFEFLKIFKTTGTGESAFNSLFGSIISLVLTIAALVAFIYLLMAGFQYITAGGDTAKAQTARTGIINALIGIIVIIVSYTILRYVGAGLLDQPR